MSERGEQSLETSRFLALGFDFAVRTPDASLRSYLDRILGSLAVPGQPRQRYRLDEQIPRSGLYELWLDGERLLSTALGERALSFLLWHVNRQAVEVSSDYLLLHASAAERDGTAVLLPAPMGSGKTTLVARLVQAGLRYVTDEVVAVDDSDTVQPYPKPLSIETGSQPLLEALRPVIDPAVAAYLGEKWYVEPLAIGPPAVAGPCVPRLVVTPCYEQGATTAVLPMRRSEAVVMLAENSFNMDRRGRRGLSALASVVRRCDCYRLTVGDLDQASALVVDLMAEAAGG